MFVSILGFQFSILGLIGIGLGIFSMTLLILKQKMTWYIWSLWISLSIIWFIHYVLFQDFASLIDTSIYFILYVVGLFSLKNKRKGR